MDKREWKFRDWWCCFYRCR